MLKNGVPVLKKVYGPCDPNNLLTNSSFWVKIRVHAENQLYRGKGIGRNVLVVWWWLVRTLILGTGYYSINHLIK